MSAGPDISRRRFFKAGIAAGGGFALAFCLPLSGCSDGGDSAARDSDFRPNAWLRIGLDNRVTVYVAEAEMGQGVYTALPMLVAEELDAAWDSVAVRHAPLEPAYGEQATGGSTSVRGGWQMLRSAGATARAMLIQAAADAWGVAPSQCHTDTGQVVHAASGRQLSYGELATQAARLPVPEGVPLKRPEQFRLIGQPVQRLDVADKVDGSARYGIDTHLPGLRIASVARCPFLGGRLRHYDDSDALQVAGVRSVHEISSGIAVVADDYWSAVKGRAALKIDWDRGDGEPLSSGTIKARFSAATRDKADSVETLTGEPNAALKAAGRQLEAHYDLPFQAHATMEPMNCTVRIQDGVCEIWAPTQVPSEAQREAENVFLGPVRSTLRKLERRLPIRSAAAVRLYPTLIGGGFGRRLKSDFVVEAVEIARLAQAPVKLIWSREDDLQHDFYRPATSHRLRAGLDDAGRPQAWLHRIVGPQRGLSVGGARHLPYAIAHVRVDYRNVDTPVPVYYWRSVSNAHNAFVIESFIDELAAAVQCDPFEYRRALMSGNPRLKAVLELAAEKAGWGGRQPPGRYLGIAAHASYGSYVAQVAEVSVSEGRLKVHRFVCAIDCGLVVNPDTVKAQMEGSIAFGLSATLKDEISIEDSRITQSNFHDYRLLRFDEMPVVETYIVESAQAPGGIGEPGVPPVAPALTNAVYAATGIRLRSLPVRAAELHSG